MKRVKFFLLCGVPGSGKSTYAKFLKDRYFECGQDITIVSSDSIRKELYGDEKEQGNPEEIFGLMRKRSIDLLDNGKSVIYDATSMTRKDRLSALSVCKSFVEKHCVVCWAPIEICIQRDMNRQRTVGKDVIDKMLKRFQPPYYDEGFDFIDIVKPDDWDQLQLKYMFDLSEELNIPHDNPHHTTDVSIHCNDAMEYAIHQNYSKYVIDAASWHDVGKKYVKSFTNKDGSASDCAHYYQHQNVGAWMCYGIPGFDEYTVWLVGTHMDPFLNTKYWNNLPSHLKNDIDNLHKADLEAH